SVNDHRGSHGTRLFTKALYHVTSCDQSQLTLYFSMSAGMHTERKRNDCFYILYGCKSNQCKKKKINLYHPLQVVQCHHGDTVLLGVHED
ncbi:unnamed protein product, partial [Staurois parvus]